MDYHDNTIHQEDGEAPSLSNLPVNTNEHENKASHQQSTEPSDQFEFFSDVSAEMSHAEDIFFRGRLVPLQEQALSNDHMIHKLSSKDDESKGFHRGRCESLPYLKMSDQSNSGVNTRLVRTSRSMDSKRMRRDLSLRFEPRNIVRASSDKSSESSDSSGPIKVSKPRWYILMFGLVKFPREMDLQDIKTRQTRRKPWQKASANQNDRKSSWDLLKILSCKNHASVAVMASSLRGINYSDSNAHQH